MKGKYLLLGTNLGDREKNLKLAVISIEKQVGKVLRRSSVFESEAWGYHDQPSFYNQVLEINTTISPESLLYAVKTIEKEMGRIRNEKWKERMIDIDILYYENEIIDTRKLIIPHPEIQNRKFTLVPLCEISAAEIHPLLGKTNLELLKETPDILEVKKI